jgi:myo-inositol-1(or 4)-monophosphatase
MAFRSAILTVMEAAARKAARSLLHDFGEVEQLQVSRKGPADFVSNADLKAEKTLRAELSRARPNFGFLMEESGATKGTEDARWIVDPLDGTTNFLHGIPHFAIVIALEQAGDVVAGLILDPIRDELFCAEKGTGAFCNQRRIRVSGRKDLKDTVIATGIPYHGRGDHGLFGAELRAVMNEVSGIRRFGAAALDLAYVAAGRCDGYWERDLSPWDVAAGTLLVREAGGYVSPIGGKPGDAVTGASIVAANDQLHGPLDRLLRQANGLSGQGD